MKKLLVFGISVIVIRHRNKLTTNEEEQSFENSRQRISVAACESCEKNP